jgi:hypothetical protein
MDEVEIRNPDYELPERYVPRTPTRKISLRTSSPLPIPFVLPSKNVG